MLIYILYSNNGCNKEGKSSIRHEGYVCHNNKYQLYFFYQNIETHTASQHDGRPLSHECSKVRDNDVIDL